MASENEIVYEIKADTKGVDKSLKNIDKSAKEVGGDGGGIGSITNAIGGIGPAAAAAAAAFAAYFVGTIVKDGISAAIQQEDALNRMNQALSNVGRLSADSSADMQAFASQIQSTTKIGDEAVMSYIALASAFTKTNGESKKLVQAAIDMSQAMGISVETAVRQLGGSLNGVSGQLGKIVPQIRGMTEEQLKAGAAIDLVAGKFGGSAAKAAETFGGRMTQLKNLFGDFLEEIGNFFIKSDSLRRALGYVTDAVKNLLARFVAFREGSGDIFSPY